MAQAGVMVRFRGLGTGPQKKERRPISSMEESYQLSSLWASHSLGPAGASGRSDRPLTPGSSPARSLGMGRRPCLAAGETRGGVQMALLATRKPM